MDELNEHSTSDLCTRRKTCLVLAIVLLGVAQHPVAEPQHVLEVGVALVAQILQLEHRTLALIRERSLQDAEDLKGQKREYDDNEKGR